MPEKPKTFAPVRQEGYRANFNLNKEDLVIAMAEWILEHNREQPMQQILDQKANTIKYFLDKIKFIRARYWLERRPESGQTTTQGHASS